MLLLIVRAVFADFARGAAFDNFGPVLRPVRWIHRQNV